MAKITRPVCAFVTFTTQEAYERCNKYLFEFNEVGQKNEDHTKAIILGQPTAVIEAPEPTNIVWEDLGITGWQMWKNNLKANILMSILVLAGFFFFWFLKYIPNSIQEMFPTTTHCGSI
jgi:hypothetical protein